MEYQGEDHVVLFYDDLWKDPRRIHRSGENLLLGWHFGYYDEHLHSRRERMLRMNGYVEELLGFGHEPMTVLDAGCGMGGTVLYLAKAHPESQFIGISLGAEEIMQARALQSTFGLQNASFSKQSYNQMEFPDGFFQAAYALESVSSGIDDDAFVRSMHRVLRENGRLIVLDGFSTVTDTTFADTLRSRILHLSIQGRPQRTFTRFRSLLARNGFTIVSETNLSRSRRVRHVFSAAVGLLFFDQISEIRANRKKNPRYLPSVSRFLIQFFTYSLIYYLLQVDYHVLVVEKTGPSLS